MSKRFNNLRAQIDADPQRRERVEQYKRAIRDALALAELRESRRVTQQELAGALGVSQANVSRIERGEDLYLSTLSNYVAALGGHLEVTAVFPEGRVAVMMPGEEPSAMDHSGADRPYQPQGYDEGKKGYQPTVNPPPKNPPQGGSGIAPARPPRQDTEESGKS